MTNIGFGARLFKAGIHGAHARMTCLHPSSDGTLLGIGDPVKLSGGVDKVGNGRYVPKVIRAASGDNVFGIVFGVEQWNVPSAINLGQRHCPASTALYLDILPVTVDDIWVMQEDAVGGSVAQADLEKNANFIVANANTTNGMSNVMLDSSTAAATNTLDLRMLGVPSIPGNTIASNAIIFCQFNKIQTANQIVGV